MTEQKQYEIVTTTLENGNTLTYKIVNGTAYSIKTPDEVVRRLENYRQTRMRVRLFYGDAETGRDWGEEYDTIGGLSRSTGQIKVPLLIKTNRSIGGCAILDDCIVKITIGHDVVYQHPNYHTGEYRFTQSSDPKYGACVTKDGLLVACFEDEHKASRWVQFMKGERNAK